MPKKQHGVLGSAKQVQPLWEELAGKSQRGKLGGGAGDNGGSPRGNRATSQVGGSSSSCSPSGPRPPSNLLGRSWGQPPGIRRHHPKAGARQGESGRGKGRGRDRKGGERDPPPCRLPSNSPCTDSSEAPGSSGAGPPCRNYSSCAKYGRPHSPPEETTGPSSTRAELAAEQRKRHPLSARTGLVLGSTSTPHQHPTPPCTHANTCLVVVLSSSTFCREPLCQVILVPNAHSGPEHLHVFHSSGPICCFSKSQTRQEEPLKPAEPVHQVTEPRWVLAGNVES